MTKTSIEWCDEVWNPVTGCNKVSQGCKHCYAERIAERFWGERKFTDVRVHPERLLELSRWRKPRRVFVNSMSDLFHESVPDEFILKVFKAMIWGNRRHTYMILTKRPERMVEWFTKYQYDVWSQSEYSAIPFPDPCVWLGVSIEDQETANKRIPLLLQTPAAVRFVSYEPALGPVDFGWVGTKNAHYDVLNGAAVWGYKRKIRPPVIGWEVIGDSEFDVIGHLKLDWIIMGGESGPNARPMNPDWARSTRDQCQAAGVPFFFKQMYVNGKLVKMPELDGRTWDEFPEAVSND